MLSLDSKQGTSTTASWDRDETVNPISECSKIAQKDYKTRHDWVGKVFHCELCKKLKFEHTTKWYMHKPKSILENEKHEIFLDFEIQIDYPISARRPSLVLIKKKGKKKKRICHLVDFVLPEDHKVKIKESKIIDKYLDLARVQKESCNMRVMMIIWTVPKSHKKILEELEIRGRDETIQTAC